MNSTWSKREKEIARRAFNNAYERECMSLIKKIKDFPLQKPNQLWDLYNMLKKRLKGIEETYDYRYSMLILVFARLIKDGYLSLEELEGLSQEKIEKISGLVSL